MRLIDADMADVVIIYDKSNELTQVSAIREYIERQRAFLDKFPTIDAVPVVRCRECKYSRINHLMKKDILSCENIDVCGEEYLFERNPNDFCSYGERKEGADNG